MAPPDLSQQLAFPSRLGDMREGGVSVRDRTSVTVYIVHSSGSNGPAWFDRESGVRVVGSSTNTDEALRAIRAAPTDVLLVCADTPGDPVALVASAEREGIAPSLVVGDHMTERAFLEFACAGASGFAAADSCSDIIEAVQCVADGEMALSSDLTRTVLKALRRFSRDAALHSSGPLSRLTPREWEVLGLLREGLTTSQIAERLVVTPTTVRGYIARIMHALHAHSRQEALAAAESLFAGAKDELH